jgi:hypothetical protein
MSFGDENFGSGNELILKKFYQTINEQPIGHRNLDVRVSIHHFH